MLISSSLSKTGCERGASQAPRGGGRREGRLVEEVFREVLEHLQGPLHSAGTNRDRGLRGRGESAKS